MEDITAHAINIAFLEGVPDPNWLDRLTLRLAQVDHRPQELSLDEIQGYFKTPDESIQRLITHHVRPETLFADLKSYLTMRWFARAQCGNNDINKECAMMPWPLWAVQGRIDLTRFRRLIGLVCYTHPNLSVSEIIGYDLFAISRETVIKRALETFSHLTKSELEDMLGAHQSFERYTPEFIEEKEDDPTGQNSLLVDDQEFDDLVVEKWQVNPNAHQQAILKILEQKQILGTKSVGQAETVLDILEAEEGINVAEMESRFSKTFSQIGSIITLDFKAFVSAFRRSSLLAGQFQYSPLSSSFGAAVAATLPDLGIADEQIITRATNILESPEYDFSTRASIAYALGTMEYKNEKAKKVAATKLYDSLNGPVYVTDMADKDGLIPRYRLEAILALARLGYTDIGGDDVMQMIVCNYGNLSKHPEARLTTVWALGILGTNPNIPPEDREKIRDTLSYYIGDPLDAVVGRGAYLWYDKVHKLVIKEA